MSKRLLNVAMMGVMALAGCESVIQSSEPAKATSVSTAAPKLEYHEVSSKSRTYVVGSTAMAQKVAGGSHPQLIITKSGYGVNGETVVFEADKDGNLEKSLMAEYASRHGK